MLLAVTWLIMGLISLLVHGIVDARLMLRCIIIGLLFEQSQFTNVAGIHMLISCFKGVGIAKD